MLLENSNKNIYIHLVYVLLLEINVNQTLIDSQFKTDVFL